MWPRNWPRHSERFGVLTVICFHFFICVNLAGASHTWAQNGLSLAYPKYLGHLSVQDLQDFCRILQDRSADESQTTQ